MKISTNSEPLLLRAKKRGVFRVKASYLLNLIITERFFMLKSEPVMQDFSEIIQVGHASGDVVATIDCGGLYYHLRLSDYDVVDCIEYSDLVKFHPDALV